MWSSFPQSAITLPVTTPVNSTFAVTRRLVCASASLLRSFRSPSHCLLKLISPLYSPTPVHFPQRAAKVQWITSECFEMLISGLPSLEPSSMVLLSWGPNPKPLVVTFSSLKADCYLLSSLINFRTLSSHLGKHLSLLILLLAVFFAVLGS